MSKDIEFPKQSDEPLVWQCGCGNASFWVYQDGSIVCVACHDTDHLMEVGVYKDFEPCND